MQWHLFDFLLNFIGCNKTEDLILLEKLKEILLVTAKSNGQARILKHYCKSLLFWFRISCCAVLLEFPHFIEEQVVF